MTKKEKGPEHPEGSERAPRRVRLPGFVSDEEIGLGDAVKRVTSYVGIRTCAGCARRAEALNRWLIFTNRRRK
jgi:hypothetical protein